MFGLEKEEIVRRDLLVYLWAKFVSNTGYRFFSRPHLENPYDLKKLKKENAVFLYTALHKSLWETSGVMSSIYFQKLPPPYIGMGDNLVKGKLFQKLAGKTGAFLVKRPQTRKDVLESSKKLKQYVIYYMAHGIDVSIFPEGTRRNIPDKREYGNFFPTAFEAILEYEKNKEKILAEYKSLTAHDVYIVPFNVDYSKVREDYEIIRELEGKPHTLHILDSLKMIRHIGDLYISFGEPIKIADHLDKTRKELAVYTREKCLELVKILPINIVSWAILDAHEAGRLGRDKILECIRENMGKLEGLKERFRGFEPGESPGDILDKTARCEKNFKNITPAHLPFYRLYADYINHYMKKK
ncbi:MAG: 1-acyl-sn-glycerol-3-phosphate acyltransferase [Candidatus Aminicenantes bacterium]|nr:1-acyl-sn-glycerol-3-phosphate acyltransferase [Candidatus Aminicenantes bacterium]